LAIEHWNPSLSRPFKNSAFSTLTFNFGPNVCTVPHKDFKNLGWGWCAVTSLGSYDHTTGGHLVLSGVTTDCCVLTTALAAVDAGVYVQVVEDACAGADAESHQKALDLMRLYSPMLEVVTLDELRDLIRAGGQ